MTTEPTIRDLSNKMDRNFSELLETINAFASHTEERFTTLEGRFDGLEGRFDGLEGRFDGLTAQVTRIEATMVTKDYLDEKLGDFKGEVNLRLKSVGA